MNRNSLNQTARNLSCWKQRVRRIADAGVVAAILLCMVVGLAACSGQGTPSAASGEAAGTGDAGVVVQDAAGSAQDAADVREDGAGDTDDPATAAAETNADKGSQAATQVPQEADIAINETIEDTGNGTHAIEADGIAASYTNVAVNKTGDSDSGDEADFYGDNAAIFATNGATLDLSEMVIKTSGTHANAVFSYGDGATVNVSDSVVETAGNCSGGLMTTGGGTMNASNLNIHTTGNSSAAIRSDRGGGTVNVDGGLYVTDGTGSPVIYSTADITVANALMRSTASQGVVIEGKNSVALNNVDLVADNNTKNSDKSDYYQAVMIYQSMSGDAAQGASTFTMTGGTLENENGDVFFVNNTVATINLERASIFNNDEDGVFLRAAAAGWGNAGSNGGQVTLNAASQGISGDMVVDDVSSLNLYLRDGSTFTGAINTSGQAGDVYVEIESGSVWTLTGDSYISSLTCDVDSVYLNGYTLYANGEAYEEGTTSTGEAIEVTVSEGGMGGMGGAPGEAPDGQGGPGQGGSAGGPGSGGSGSGGTPPSKPDGEGGPGADEGGTPPKPPSGSGGHGSGSGGTPPDKPGSEGGPGSGLDGNTADGTPPEALDSAS